MFLPLANIPQYQIWSSVYSVLSMWRFCCRVSRQSQLLGRGMCWKRWSRKPAAYLSRYQTCWVWLEKLWSLSSPCQLTFMLCTCSVPSRACKWAELLCRHGNCICTETCTWFGASLLSSWYKECYTLKMIFLLFENFILHMMYFD